MKVQVNTSLDTSDGYNIHFFGLVPYVPVTLLPSLEGRAIMAHYGGEGPGLHRLTISVWHKFRTIVQEGHDCGFNILDHTIPPYPVNQYEPAIWPHTSRKIAFAASTVKMDGEPTGCAADGADTLPLMTCGDVAALPLAFPRTSGANTVWVGMTEKDVKWGWINIAISVALDVLFFAISLPFKIPEKGFELFMALLTAILGKFLPITDIKKFLVGLATGVLSAIARWLDEGQDVPISIELPPRNPHDEDEPRVIITFDPKTGRWGKEERPRKPVNVPKAPYEKQPGSPAPAPEQTLLPGEETDSWGPSLVPPDERPGWVYEDAKGWVLP